MPNDATMPLFRKSKELGIALSFGYAELTPDGSHYNTSILTDKRGKIIVNTQSNCLDIRIRSRSNISTPREKIFSLETWVFPYGEI